MKDFAYYLDKTQEIGFVDQVFHSIIYAHGLPHAHPGEVVLFETGEIGYVLSLNDQSVEISLLSPPVVDVGVRIARTNSYLSMKVSDDYLGMTITSADLEKNTFALEETEADGKNSELREVDTSNNTFTLHKKITEPLETGVKVVDLLVPIGVGQRELLLGDRKTGKSNFVLQTIRTQAQKGCICVYASIGKSQLEIQRLTQFFQSEQISKQTVFIASNSAQRTGLIFLTPYVAMTVAEYFRDQGKKVLLVLDDLTTHARYYRELMLLAKRFPGRNSYPGDIFHIHARLLERGGNFKTGSITIQTNLMSITDGHILFDNEYFDQGRRPAVNPFLSVTRVGEQTQTPLAREIGRTLRTFLADFEKIQQFKHFQTELNEAIQYKFYMGERLINFLDQDSVQIVPFAMTQVLFGAIWADFWKNQPHEQIKKYLKILIDLYRNDIGFQKQIDGLIAKSEKMNDFIENIKQQQDLLANNPALAAATPAPVSATPTAPTSAAAAPVVTAVEPTTIPAQPTEKKIK